MTLMNLCEKKQLHREWAGGADVPLRILTADFLTQKKRKSGAGNCRADFMGAWHFLVLSPGKPPCPQILLLGGGGVLGFLERGGGRSANFIFMGVGIFPTYQ